MLDVRLPWDTKGSYHETEKEYYSGPRKWAAPMLSPFQRVFYQQVLDEIARRVG
jgi:hypothetical protein